MNRKATFRFTEAIFDVGGGVQANVQLVAGEANKGNGTHITLLMGANGTCKSRLLSSCVDLICRIEERQVLVHEPRVTRPRRPDPFAAALHCINATLECNGKTSTVGDNSIFETEDCLPSRLLAIANLVRDRFTFVDWGIEDASRYYYLGVRQSSNLTTTGAMDRIAAESYVRILGDHAKTNTFGNWALQLFPNCQLGIGFDDFSPTRVDRFLLNPEGWVQGQFGRGGSSRWPEEKLQRAKKAMPEIKRLFQFLQEHGQEHESNSAKGVRRGRTRILQPQKLPRAAHEEFGGLRQSFSLASSLRLIGRPSFMLNTGAWMNFTQLSSGEQNLLATGARLIGFATPGSFIVIDEPEVSLNVAWQQRYIELILGALEHAHGSHILIASHSPYLVADLHADNATVVVVERRGKELNFKSHSGRFWGWGSEAILYEVLGLPSASNYHFSRELAAILKLVENDSKDVVPFQRFLEKCDQLDLPADAEPLRLVIEEIRTHYQGLNA